MISFKVRTRPEKRILDYKNWAAIHREYYEEERERLRRQDRFFTILIVSLTTLVCIPPIVQSICLILKG